MNPISEIIHFEIPGQLACPDPTELRKIARDDVRLLVTTGSGNPEHALFNELDHYLIAGDVLVINTSATQPAAFPVNLPEGKKGMLHFSTQINKKEWLAEIREIKGNKTIRWKAGKENMTIDLPGNASIRLKAAFYDNRDLLHLWIVEPEPGHDVQSYMVRYGKPIQYENLDKHYPLDFYQTFFSFHPGSSEMPSAGRGFTRSLVNKLLKKGIQFAPILLHTGVSSLEENESPYPEYMEVSPVTAVIINQAKKRGGRVIAVGTTAIRAVETATSETGDLVPFKGKTGLYIRNGYEMKTVNGLLTGFHEPLASHLNMLQSLAGYAHIERAYKEALDHGYYWHQFGDLHLILP